MKEWERLEQEEERVEVRKMNNKAGDTKVRKRDSEEGIEGIQTIRICDSRER